MWRLNIILIFTLAPVIIMLFVIHRAMQIAKEEEKTIRDIKTIIDFIVPLLPEIQDAVKATRKATATIKEGERRLQDGIAAVDTLVESVQTTTPSASEQRKLDNTIQRIRSFVDT